MKYNSQIILVIFFKIIRFIRRNRLAYMQIKIYFKSNKFYLNFWIITKHISKDIF